MEAGSFHDSSSLSFGSDSLYSSSTWYSTTSELATDSFSLSSPVTSSLMSFSKGVATGSVDVVGTDPLLVVFRVLGCDCGLIHGNGMAGKGEHGNHGAGNGQTPFGVGNVPLGVENIPNGVGKMLPPAVPLGVRCKKSIDPNRCRISILFAGSLSRASISLPKSPFCTCVSCTIGKTFTCH